MKNGERTINIFFYIIIISTRGKYTFKGSFNLIEGLTKLNIKKCKEQKSDRMNFLKRKKIPRPYIDAY